MGALQKVMAQVLTRLRDTSASQRIALFLGGALVAISLIWMLYWAATPQMVPLLNQELSAEDLVLVQSGLDALGRDYTIEGSQVMVPGSTNKAALLAQLQLQEKLPANTSVTFAKLVEQSDPWISQAENKRRWTYALGKELETVLRQLRGVRSASVLLNLGTQERTFTRNHPASSASVTLVMGNGEPVSRQLALAAARLVAGAVAGLAVRNVEVVDANGNSAIDWASEADVTTQLDRKLAKEEQRYLEKIKAIIPDMKALIGVQVELDTSSYNLQSQEPTQGVTIRESRTEKEITRGRPSGEPGVRANAGQAVTTAAQVENQREATSDTDLQPGFTRKEQTTPAGEIMKVSAAISLSQSYLEGIVRRTNPDAETIDETLVEQVFERERTRLLQQVVRLVKPQVEENVAIARYYDVARQTDFGGSSGALDEAVLFVKNYGAQSGLGLLALVSLAMMLRMARKTDAGESFGMELGLPKEAIEAAKMAASDISTVVGRARQRRGPVAGQVGGGGPDGAPSVGVAGGPIEQTTATEGMLVAQEVDAGTVQTRKMVEQVAQMVDNDAELVSTLIEQWIQRDERFSDEGL
jgi:flagellar biosynthesis/type III secretory pathway M-ring protein FliF/YscJ